MTESNHDIRPRSTHTSRSRRFARAASFALAATLAPGLLTACATPGVMDPVVSTLNAKEQVRSILLEVTDVVDRGDASRLAQLAPNVAPNFSLTVINLLGNELRYEGLNQVIAGFNQILVSVDRYVAPSAIAVEVSGDNATAMMTMISAGTVPAGLDPDLQPGQRALLYVDVRADFRREGERWILTSMRADQDIVLRGAAPI